MWKTEDETYLNVFYEKVYSAEVQDLETKNIQQAAPDDAQ